VLPCSGRGSHVPKVEHSFAHKLGCRPLALSRWGPAETLMLAARGVSSATSFLQNRRPAVSQLRLPVPNWSNDCTTNSSSDCSFRDDKKPAGQNRRCPSLPAPGKQERSQDWPAATARACFDHSGAGRALGASSSVTPATLACAGWVPRRSPGLSRPDAAASRIDLRSARCGPER
jgi:hypothetical protein